MLVRKISKSFLAARSVPKNYLHTIDQSIRNKTLKAVTLTIKEFKQTRRLHSTMSDSSIITNDKVYVQRDLEKNMMRISFEYSINGKLRSFNLLRERSEPVSSAITRIKLNLSKLCKRGKVAGENDQHKVDLTIDGSTIDISSVHNINAWIDGAILVINDKSFEVTTDCPLVESIKLPTCTMKGFIVVPNVTLSNCTINQCKFLWYRQIASKKRNELTEEERRVLQFDGRNHWLKISDDLTFSPTEHEVACHIKLECIPSDGSRDGPKSSLESLYPVELGPSELPFEKRHLYTCSRLESSDEFRIISYNILADLYADSDYSRTVLFGHCPAHALEIDYRRQLLLKEISGYNADLMCLQEVDRKEFERTYKPFFEHKGDFSGIFDAKGGQVAEGCAVFYRNDKFELIETHKTLLSELIVPNLCVNSKLTTNEANHQSENLEPQSHPFLNNPIEIDRCLAKFEKIRIAVRSNEQLKKRLLDRHTIIQITLLKLRCAMNKYLIIANTHLYFAPDADHVRLLQGSICVKYMEYIKDYYLKTLAKSGANQPEVSIIFCGDMNSTPDCGLYSLLTKGHVPDSLADWSSNKEESVIGLSVDTCLRFLSAYEDVKYTNYTMEFNGCLDYIYYDSESLTCKNIVPLPSHEDVTAIGGLPSDVFPSDHLALIADLKLSK